MKFSLLVMSVKKKCLYKTAYEYFSACGTSYNDPKIIVTDFCFCDCRIPVNKHTKKCSIVTKQILKRFHSAGYLWHVRVLFQNPRNQCKQTGTTNIGYMQNR